MIVEMLLAYDATVKVPSRCYTLDAMLMLCQLLH